MEISYIIKKITCVFCLLLLFSCDFDRFFGYNHNADEQLKSTNVFGNITNVFTGEAIDRAIIHIGDVITESDVYGDYFIKYALTEDEDRNAPIPITINAPQYYDFEDEVLLYPLNNEYSFELVRAAPVIVESALASEYPDAGGGFLPVLWSQVHIKDYQGISTIIKVTSTVYYSNDLQKPIEFELKLKKEINTTEAYFQLWIPGFNHENGYLQYKSTYTVRAYDNEGYIEIFTGMARTSSLIFPPRQGD